MRGRGGWRIFARDRVASVAVEFAMVGGLLISLVFETMQIGLYFYTSASLDRATAAAMRQVMTGTINSKTATVDTFKTATLCPMLPAAMSCANVVVNVRNVAEDTAPNGFYQFVNSDQSDVLPPSFNAGQTSFCTGTSGSVIYAQVYYGMPAISPIWRTFGAVTFNGGLVHFVSSFATFKNEPFQAASGAC